MEGAEGCRSRGPHHNSRGASVCGRCWAWSRRWTFRCRSNTPGQPGGTASAAGAVNGRWCRRRCATGRHGTRGGFTRQSGIQLADPALNPLEGARLSATLPAASASALFAGSPHTLDELQALAKNGDALPSFPLSVTVHATTTTKVISTVEAPNVVALLEGSDPKLKHEVPGAERAS